MEDHARGVRPSRAVRAYATTSRFERIAGNGLAVSLRSPAQVADAVDLAALQTTDAKYVVVPAARGRQRRRILDALESAGVGLRECRRDEAAVLRGSAAAPPPFVKVLGMLTAISTRLLGLRTVIYRVEPARPTSHSPRDPSPA